MFILFGYLYHRIVSNQTLSMYGRLSCLVSVACHFSEEAFVKTPNHSLAQHGLQIVM